MRLGLAVCLALAACANEEGVIVEFVLASDVRPDEVDTLDIWIGMASPETPEMFVRDPDANDMRHPVAFPYRVLFAAGDEPRRVLIGGTGRNSNANNARIAEGSLGPIDVVPGDLVFGGTIVLRRDVPVCFDGDSVTIGDSDMDGVSNCNDCAPMDETNAPGLAEQCDGVDNNCDVKADTDDDMDLITYHHTAGMPDDGFWADTCEHARADCDDMDGEQYPNALERCNGETDSCERRTIGKRPCFYFDTALDGCMVGERACDDTIAGGAWAACEQGSSLVAVPDQVCELWPQYESASWPEEAMIADPLIPAQRCEVVVVRDTNTPCGAPGLVYDPGVAPQGPFGPVCRSTLIGGGRHDGYDLKLRVRGNPSVPDDVRQDFCTVDVVVEAIAGQGDPTMRLPKVAVLLLYEFNTEVDPTTIQPMPVVISFEPRFGDGACPMTPTCEPIP